MTVLDQWGLAAVAESEWNVGAVRARVVRVDRGECDVMTEQGQLRVLSDSQRSQDELAPVTGDWVELSESEGLGWVIARILPRRTQVSRRDPAERDVEQVLASNVDVVAVVHGLDRPLPAGRLERLLVVALQSGAQPLVVLTKADEGLSEDGDTAEMIARALAGSIPVVVTSVVTGRGLDEVIARVATGQTLALVGASGVGKSSLINALVGDEVLAVGEVREGDAKGRHTTTARELIRLPDGGGLVLDTPGIRSIGLWEAEQALEMVFADLGRRTEQCRFRDCAHGREPDCALRAAVAAGEVEQVRLDRFLSLVGELNAQQEREEQRRWRTGNSD